MIFYKPFLWEIWDFLKLDVAFNGAAPEQPRKMGAHWSSSTPSRHIGSSWISFKSIIQTPHLLLDTFNATDGEMYWSCLRQQMESHCTHQPSAHLGRWLWRTLLPSVTLHLQEPLPDLPIERLEFAKLSTQKKKMRALTWYDRNNNMESMTLSPVSYHYTV